MIVELIFSRGLAFLIDGNRPTTKSWGFGGEGLKITFSANDHRQGSRHSMSFGDLQVADLTIELDNSNGGYWQDLSGQQRSGLPSALHLTTNRGIITATVTDVVEGGVVLPPLGEIASPISPTSIASDMDTNADIDPNDEYAGLEDNDEFQEHGQITTVTLANGETAEIDEYKAYLRAET